MCFAGNNIGAILNPLKLPLPLIDPGGSLVNAGVKATGVKGAAGATASIMSGLEGTIDTGKSSYNHMMVPKYLQPAPSAPAPQTQLPTTTSPAIASPLTGTFKAPGIDTSRNTTAGLLTG